MYLDMSQSDADIYELRGTDEGGKLKETGTEHWDSPNASATNERGFSALPGGYRDYVGYYYDVGSTAAFRSSTEYDSYLTWCWYLSCISSEVGRGYGIEQFGSSVRCVRD